MDSYHEQIKRNTQQTSLDSFWHLSERQLGERQRQVLVALAALQKGTNTMISRQSGIPINIITARIFELRQEGKVIEAKRDFCKITKRRAIYWRIA